jgi:hypothetical protein
MHPHFEGVLPMLPDATLVIGWYYPSIICHGCKNVVPIAAGHPDKDAREFFVPPTMEPPTMGCPFCGLSDKYSGAELKIRKLPKLPPQAH